MEMEMEVEMEVEVGEMGMIERGIIERGMIERGMIKRGKVGWDVEMGAVGSELCRGQAKSSRRTARDLSSVLSDVWKER